MIKLYIATDEAVAVVRQHDGEWVADAQMVGSQPQRLAVDTRRSGDRQWRQVRNGFPEPRGLLTSVLAIHEAGPGIFYAANNPGVFRSVDAGSSWEALPVRWPQGVRFGRAHALVVAQE